MKKRCCKRLSAIFLQGETVMRKKEILFEPTSSISNYTVVAYSHRNEAPVAIVTGGVLPTAGCFAGLGCLYGTEPAQLGVLQSQLGIRTVSSSFPVVQKGKQYNGSNILTIALAPNLQLKYILGYVQDL
jgi:iron complex outermembrane recepter protein